MSISLTDILLREVNTERSDAILVELGADAAIQIPQSTDVVAHFVLDGEITITGDEIETPVTMRRSEYGLLLYGSKHRISVAESETQTQDHAIAEWPVGDEPATLSLGTGKPGARFISAALRLVHNPVSVQCQHPLDELLHLKHGLQPFFMDSALLVDVNQISAGCRGPGANAFINALLNLHLAHAMRCGFHKMQRALPGLPNPQDVTRSPTTRPIAVAIRLLHQHPERCWTVAKLAQELGSSRSSFAERFHALVGLGPMEYLNSVRMEKAAELLQFRPDLPLCVVGRQVGYDNANSFIRAFKSHFSVTPRSFSTLGGLAEVSGAPAQGRRQMLGTNALAMGFFG